MCKQFLKINRHICEEVKLINEEIQSKLRARHLEDIDNVTAEEVKKAASKLKLGKSDPLSSFSSDCLKYNSSLLHTVGKSSEENMFRDFLLNFATEINSNKPVAISECSNCLFRSS